MRFAACIPFFVVMSAGLAMAQESRIDPDLFSQRQAFVGPPHYVREATLARTHLPDAWPFSVDQGNIMCVTVDNVVMAFFDSDGAEQPFMLGENIIMTFIGRMITGENGYLRAGIEPARLIADLEKTYHAALVRCGPPYAQ
jgi:hypothetical protein